jgi:hypothetical protein
LYITPYVKLRCLSPSFVILSLSKDEAASKDDGLSGMLAPQPASIAATAQQPSV